MTIRSRLNRAEEDAEDARCYACGKLIADPRAEELEAREGPDPVAAFINAMSPSEQDAIIRPLRDAAFRIACALCVNGDPDESAPGGELARFVRFQLINALSPELQRRYFPLGDM